MDKDTDTVVVISKRKGIFGSYIHYEIRIPRGEGGKEVSTISGIIETSTPEFINITALQEEREEKIDE